jgi:hypothetical protein
LDFHHRFDRIGALHGQVHHRRIENAQVNLHHPHAVKNGSSDDCIIFLRELSGSPLSPPCNDRAVQSLVGEGQGSQAA